jgi:hypothetical protein
VSVAETSTPPVVPPTVTLSPMWASVLLVWMSTMTEPATAALSPPAPPTEISLTSSLCVADTFRTPPLAWRFEFAPTPESTVA